MFNIKKSLPLKGFGRHKSGKAHPIHGKKGIKETDFSISEKGNNEKIEVKIDPIKKSMKHEEKLIDKINVSFKDDGYGPYFDDDKKEGVARNKYLVTLTNNGKSFTFPFGDSIINTENGETPFNSTEEHEKYKKDIIEMITSDYYNTEQNYPTYDDFANAFGYGEDSGKGEKMYGNVLKQAEGLHRVFTDKEIEEIRNELEL